MKKSNNDSSLTTKWSHRRFIVGLTALAVSLALQAQDYARLGEHSMMGTARYVGFGGAMSAIGGDPSAVRDNPAGLGLYRRAEILLTADYMLDRTRQTGNDAQKRGLLMLPQASWVICLPTTQAYEHGVQTNNLMFSYHRIHSYSRNIRAAMGEDYSLGGLFAATGVDLKIPYNTADIVTGHDIILQESGYVNEYALDWAMNISNKWYIGLGLHMQSHMFVSEGDYYETFDGQSAKDGKTYSNQNVNYLRMSGVGGTLTTGLIYRPCSWLRLGFGIHTPSIGTVNTYSEGKLLAQTDTFCTRLATTQYNASDFHMPLHTTTSVAFQIGYYGLISFQYDYYHQKNEQDCHSLRTGFEVIPVPGLYINGGYVYESSFSKADWLTPIDPNLDRMDAYFQCPKRSQYASLAIGYRGKYVIAQAAYQYRWQNIHLYAHQDAFPYDIHTDTHRIVFTLGWHRY